MFLMKLDGDGHHCWDRTYGSFLGDWGRAVDIGPDGLYLTACFADTVDFGGGIRTAGGYDVVVVAMDPDGDYRWDRTWLGAGNDYAGHLQAGILGNVYVSGSIYKSLDFGGGNRGRGFFLLKLGYSYSGAATEIALHSTITLHQNHPNPFNPTTTISFTLPAPAHVRLAVYNVEGKLVKRLINGTRDEGNNRAVWDGTDIAGKPVSSGIYFCRLEVGGQTLTKKMVLLE
jgi:hypothetical protein